MLPPIDFVHFVDELASVSGDAILPFFRTSLGVDNKNLSGGFDPVTEADRAAEQAMRKLINAQFPAHGIIGEEFGSEQEEAEYVWVLDPIDGTKSFISGLPVWGTLIGLKHHGAPVYGMMHQPYIKERFSGDGASAEHNGPRGKRQMRVRGCDSLAAASVFTTSPLLMTPEERARYARVEERARLPRYGGDCYAFCMLAAGHIDAVVETGLKPYDIAPLIPIILGAGGVVSCWDRSDATGGGQVVAAASQALLDEILDRLG